MEDLKIQQNLEENIKKLFEKLREEGSKGIKTDENSYPIEIQSEVFLIDRRLPQKKPIAINNYKTDIKNYNSYMKLIQTLGDLIHLYRKSMSDNNYNKQFSNYFYNKIETEIELIQNTTNKSLDKNYIKQYSCLIKCYELLLYFYRSII